MTLATILLWLSVSPPPAWTSGPETVRIDWLRVDEEQPAPGPATPVRAGRTTCVTRPRPIRPRLRHLVRVRRWSGNVAEFVELEVTPEQWRGLRLDAVVELQSLAASDEDVDQWWP